MQATIPLQSFNLDCGRGETTPAAKPSVAYLRTLSAPGGQTTAVAGGAVAGKGLPCQRKSLAESRLTNLQGALKIEEVGAECRRQQPLETVPKRVVGINIGSPMLMNRNVVTPPPAQVKLAATAIGKVGGATPGYLVDVTKKGSTSTIWTSEESILRSVGAVDEDNK